MASCKNCSFDGVYERLDEYGLCPTCSTVVFEDMERQMQEITKLMDMSANGRPIDEISSTCTAAHRRTIVLMEYEAKGIDFGDINPTDITAYISGVYDRAIDLRLESIVREGMKGAADTTSARLKQHAIRVALLELKTFQNEHNIPEENTQHEMMLVMAMDAYKGDECE